MARPVVPLDLAPDDARKAAFAAGLRLLAGREMSTARLRDRLLRRGLPPEAVEEAAARLTRAGLLDDARAARAAARTLVAVKLRGRHRVGRELERMGFAPALVAVTLADTLGESDERAVIARVIKTRLHGQSRIPDAAAYRRLFSSLMRRGFPGSLIRESLRPYWGSRSTPVEDAEE